MKLFEKAIIILLVFVLGITGSYSDVTINYLRKQIELKKTSTKFDVYFGLGCYWRMTHTLVANFEQAVLNRKDTEITGNLIFPSCLLTYIIP